VGSRHPPQLTQPFQWKVHLRPWFRGITNCMPFSKYRVATYSTSVHITKITTLMTTEASLY